jgi:undecaprenyl-diphosphatase
MYFFFAFMLGALLSNTLKQIIGRERPFVTYHDIEKLSTGGSPSFPSGHTTEVFCAATILALLYGRHPAVILAFVWAALVAYTRMALGVHYPGDVIGASMLGMASALIVKLTLDYILERRRM